MNAMLKILEEQLRNGEWNRRGEYCIKRGDLELWIANGWQYFTGHHGPLHIPFFSRPRLWLAYREGQRKQAMEIFTRATE